VGPWFHGAWGGRSDGSRLGNIRFNANTSEWYQNNVEVPFFNYHLKGKGDIRKIAEASIFFSGENNWKQLPQWPPANAETETLYLQSNGGLSWAKPSNAASANGFSAYVSDPMKPVPYTEDIHLSRTREYMTDDQRFAARRPDVLVFETPVLENDVTLAGPLNANLFVSTSTTDVDFVVKLIDVFPDTFKYMDDGTPAPRPAGTPYPMGGYQMLVRGEVMRGKFRKSFETPVPFSPNKVEEVKFYMPDIAHTFKKGHRLMVQIQSSWFPLVDRNPQKFVNIYEASANDFQKANIKIYHSSQYPSGIAVPVLK
jgi:putative CocE/NonD family hydrolase